MFSCSFCIYLTGTIIICLIWKRFVSLRFSSDKICGVYSTPGAFYGVKLIIFWLLMKFRNRKGRPGESTDKWDAGYGKPSRSCAEEMEQIQPLSNHDLAIDAVYFNGADDKGFYFVTGMARRAKSVVNGFFIFRIPELGILVSPKFPDAMLFKGSNNFFGAEGFQYKPVLPMKIWELSYEGDLKSYEDSSKKYKVTLKATWTSHLPYFDFDCMLLPWTMSKAIAREEWSREYFERLKSAHQTHYEQHGNLIGQIVVDGKVHKFNIPSMRDHSYAVKRDWKLLHRYIFHMFSLNDGRRFNIGVVSQPCTTSQLELAYMYEGENVIPITEVGLNLFEHGELGTAPVDYGFSVKTENNTMHRIQVQVLETQELHIGFEWEARIVERRCRFIVDGIEGWGVSECMYRNANGRPEQYSKCDEELP